VNWIESPLFTLTAAKTRWSQSVPVVEALNKPHSVIAKVETKLIVATLLYTFADGFDGVPVTLAVPAGVCNAVSPIAAAVVPVPQS
jgi:hypothetical protein